MARKCLIVFLLLGFSLSINAQIEKEGNPRLMKKKSVLSEGLPVYSLPSFDIEKYKQKMLNSNHKKLKFARMFDLSVDIRKQAKKITEENGTLYVLSIRSKKAFSLSPVFDTYELPDKAELFIYNPEFSHVKGAFTSENNKVTEKLPVGPVRGEEIIIEYYEPHNRPFDGKLKLAKVGHDFVDIYGYLEQKSSGVGASEDCNVNINCEAGEEFQDIKQAVCRVIYNGWLCSGSLINNTNFDGSPYFLTANHCISSESEAQDAVFYFNFESPECDTSYIDDYQTISVSDLVATAPDSKLDFSLLEISESIPINYKPYYAGWNLDSANIENTTTIHHPSGDVKKITKDDDAPVSANYGSTYDEYSHWLIEDWELGTTEGGSSGAPLFDQQKRIIGDLTGGEASCDYNFNDYFAKISRSWNDFGSPDHQMEYWLDPNSTHFQNIDGYYPYQDRPSNLIAVYDSVDVTLNWNPPINKSEVNHYELFRNDSLIADVGETSYVDTSVVEDSTYFYKVRADLGDSLTSFSDSVGLVPAELYQLPFNEYFESYDSLASGWYYFGLQGNTSWEIKTGGYQNTPDTSSEGSSNAYFYGAEGGSARLVGPKINMEEEAYVDLTFDLAMPSSQGNVDQLDLYIRYSDYLPWQKIQSFQDEVDSWQEQKLQLPKTSQDYLIAFEAKSNNGGGVYLDNLTVKKDENAVSEPKLNVSDKTICSGESTVISIDTNDVYDTYFWAFGYGAQPETASAYGPHEVNYAYKGLKKLKLIINEDYTSYYSGAIEVYETPSPTITYKDDSILVSNYEEGNQWYLNGDAIENADSSVFYPKETGEYLLKVTSEYGCIGISDTLEISSLGFTDNSGEDILEIFPNPAGNRLFLRLDQEMNNATYLISNADGQIVKRGSLDNTMIEHSIFIKDLPAGVYFLNIQSPYRFPVKRKFIKL